MRLPLSSGPRPLPRFSVIVPAYNASVTIRETLDALLAQESGDWECIVVDDGSTDNTAAIAQEYVVRDSRFRLIRQENRGTAGAYRTGIAAATADLLVICAADDLLLPAHLRAMGVLVHANPDYEIYSSNGEYLFHDTGERKVVYAGEEWQVARSLSLEQVVEECFFSVGVAFRRRVLDVAGGHRTGVYVDDYDLWLRAMARGARHLYTPQVLALHRVSSFQQSFNLIRLLESNIEVYENLLAQGDVAIEVRPAIQDRIDRTRDWIVDIQVDSALETQAQRLRHVVDEAVGSRHAESVMRVVHAVSWITRPLRRAAAKLAAR